MLLRRIVAGLVLLTTAIVAQADEAMRLRYKMEADKPLIFKNTMTLNQKQSFMGQEIVMDMTTTDVAERTLQEIDDKGNLHIQTENKHLKVSMKMNPLGEYTFDSKSTERDEASALGGMISPVFDRLSGAILTVVISPRGEVEDLKGYKELMEGVLENNPFAASFAGGGSDEAQKLQMNQLFPTLPEKPISPGDKWEEPYEIELPKLGKFNGKTVFTYQGMEKKDGRNLAKITSRSEMSFNLDITMDQATVTGQMSIKDSSGTILFDPKQGQIVSIKDEVTMGGDMTITAGGQVIPATIEQKQTVTSEQLQELPE